MRLHYIRAPPGNVVVEAVPDGGYGWTIVGASAVLTFWVNGYTTVWGIFQNAIITSTNVQTDLRTITFVGSSFMACIVAFGLLSVRLMRPFGVRSLSVAAAAIFGIGLIATSFVLESVGRLFCIAGALIGLASSFVFTATNTLPIQWFSRRLGLAHGIVKMGGGVGATILPPITQALIDSIGLRWTFRAFGLCILATETPSAFLLKDRMPPAATSRFDWSMLKDLTFVTLTLAGAVAVFAMYVPPYFLPLFASSIELSSSMGAGLVAGFGASTAMGRLIGGWFCDRVGAVNALAITTLGNSLSMFAIWPVSSSPPPLFVFAILNGCANGSFFVALPTAVASIAASGSAAASVSLMIFFWAPGYLVGPPLAGMRRALCLTFEVSSTKIERLDHDRGITCLAASYKIVLLVNNIVDRVYDRKEMSISLAEELLRKLKEWAREVPEFLHTPPLPQLPWTVVICQIAKHRLAALGG
ncbi:unnamed protein product [Clonostachys chloroleuca]|uniref:Major facilitator superfamily (MFS) profile domain-containing protein n=1 Tax=Clonostachys chloroleuca TaxID=1926264 RepID=A0AA35MF84_9HYPO|nr:unnamed protein product [Clonostachys chloroleuca]